MLTFEIEADFEVVLKEKLKLPIGAIVSVVASGAGLDDGPAAASEAKAPPSSPSFEADTGLETIRPRQQQATRTRLSD
jgi:hypothetical protein